MRVVEGRYADALDAFREASQDEDWASLAPGDAPARVEGAKPVAYEIAAANGWAAPDWVVVPTGQVTGLLGVHRGFQDLVALDLIEAAPRLVAAQAAGCEPLVAAHREGETDPRPADAPDSVCGELEIPDPAAGGLALAAIAESDGTAVGVQDDAILAGARTLAEAGVPGGVTGGAAMRAAAILAERGEIGREESVVLVNPVSANKEADLMRSHLMSTGV
jgi:threonine synthase